MSPLLPHSNKNQYNINGLLCSYSEMFRIQTCCNNSLSAAEGFQGQEAGGNMSGSMNFCQFYLVFSLFYSLKRGSNGFIAEKTILILYKGSRGGPFFSGFRGCPIFSRGGGVQMLISIETHIRTCYFPGGVSGPPIPLWIRTWAMPS